MLSEAIEAYHRATPEPVAPTPSPAPDIAGLVERLAKWGRCLDPDRDGFAAADIGEAAIALQRVAQERDAANVEIARLQAIVGKDPSTVMIAFEDGAHQRLSRAAGDAIRRAEAAEARIATARDALEAISSPTQTEGLLWWQIRAREALAAIRALKGTKP
jgi:hypothetical protein